MPAGQEMHASSVRAEDEEKTKRDQGPRGMLTLVLTFYLYSPWREPESSEAEHAQSPNQIREPHPGKQANPKDKGPFSDPPCAILRPVRNPSPTPRNRVPQRTKQEPAPTFPIPGAGGHPAWLAPGPQLACDQRPGPWSSRYEYLIRTYVHWRTDAAPSEARPEADMPQTGNLPGSCRFRFRPYPAASRRLLAKMPFIPPTWHGQDWGTPPPPDGLDSHGG
ncbi:hypothetical protein HIM_04149 [Hirsutella minnesotensis 3608]|uniref:Uncharacterized protein n=1 Tax=Hirsutella minnesotensis 3608 TaxID=1043627 RepID=A0A0F7ZQ07_9HYPO|nr:hypothetical protein HIM_04149 [Hirsutella minnesotensis 3608]